jgi:hypothetical protein
MEHTSRYMVSGLYLNRGTEVILDVAEASQRISLIYRPFLKPPFDNLKDKARYGMRRSKNIRSEIIKIPGT